MNVCILASHHHLVTNADLVTVVVLTCAMLMGSRRKGSRTCNTGTGQEDTGEVTILVLIRVYRALTGGTVMSIGDRIWLLRSSLLRAIQALSRLWQTTPG